MLIVHIHTVHKLGDFKFKTGMKLRDMEFQGGL